MLSEKQIIKDCQRGKKSSQYELVKRYSAMLMTVCRRYLPDEATAKDVLQESFIRIFRNIDQYQPTGSFEGWMRKITVRSALQWLKKSYMKRETAITDLNYDDGVDPAIYSQLEAEALIQLIQTLPDGFRTVFNLNIIEGYSHKEIAELLNITESASRSQLTRARSLLRKKIGANQLKNHRSA